MQWHLYRVALKANIEKMFRHIRVDRRDSDFQRILWRRSGDRDPVVFRLTTVTYETACAPFLAQRVLLRLAEDEGEQYPRGTEVLRRNFYVDDVLFGADTLEEVKAVKEELSALLKRGGFTLRKWASNNPVALGGDQENEAVDLSQEAGTDHPVLGLR